MIKNVVVTSDTNNNSNSSSNEIEREYDHLLPGGTAEGMMMLGMTSSPSKGSLSLTNNNAMNSSTVTSPAPPKSDQAIMQSLQKSLLLGPSATAKLSSSTTTTPMKASRRTNSIYITHFTDGLQSRSYAEETTTTTTPQPVVYSAGNNGNSNRKTKKAVDGVVVLTGTQLKRLLQMKPELSEYLYMEIMNMKYLEQQSTTATASTAS